MDLVEPMQCQQNTSLLAKNKMMVVAPPHSPDPTPCNFFFVPRDESGFEREVYS